MKQTVISYYTSYLFLIFSLFSIIGNAGYMYMSKILVCFMGYPCSLPNQLKILSLSLFLFGNFSICSLIYYYYTRIKKSDEYAQVSPLTFREKIKNIRMGDNKKRLDRNTIVKNMFVFAVFLSFLKFMPFVSFMLLLNRAKNSIFYMMPLALSVIISEICFGFVGYMGYYAIPDLQGSYYPIYMVTTQSIFKEGLFHLIQIPIILLASSVFTYWNKGNKTRSVACACFSVFFVLLFTQLNNNYLHLKQSDTLELVKKYGVNTK